MSSCCSRLKKTHKEVITELHLRVWPVERVQETTTIVLSPHVWFSADDAKCMWIPLSPLCALDIQKTVAN